MKSKFSALILTSANDSSFMPMNTNIIKHNENSNPKRCFSFEEFESLENRINS